MGWTVLSCALIATFLTMLADPVISSPQDYIPPDPEPAALFNSGKAVKREALQQLRDYVKQEDSLLHDLRKESFSTLRELVKEGDGNVQDRLLLGLAQSKGRDDQLKEELDEDVAWLKDQLTKGQRRLNEELTEEEARRKEEFTEQKENLDNLRSSVKQWTEPSIAVIDDLKKQMTDIQVELKSTKQQLQTTQTELETSQRNLQSMQETVRSNQESIQSSQSSQAALSTSQEKVSSIEEELQRTSEQLRHQEEAFTAVQTQLQDEVHSLKVEVDSLQSSYALLNSSELVAFSVRFSQDDGQNGIALGHHATLLFDTVLTNLGHGYNPQTGLFTAPVAGLYVFFLSAMSTNARGPLQLAIAQQGKPLLDRIYMNGSSDPEDQGSTQVTTHLSVGEQVWVRQVAGDAVRGSFWTIFTGFLVQAD